MNMLSKIALRSLSKGKNVAQQVKNGQMIERSFSLSSPKAEKLGDKFSKLQERAKKIRYGRVCITAPRRSEFKCKPPFPPVGNWILHEECKPDSCDKTYPPFDTLYYKTSDKDKRCYQQTWSECPNLIMKHQPICCQEFIQTLPYEKRTLEDIRRVTRKDEAKSDKKKDPKDPCPKVTLPCCPPVREDLKCIPVKLPKECTKQKCPYPSFSECTRPRTKRLTRGECTCWQFDGMCEVWEAARKAKLGKSIGGAKCS